MPRRVAPLPAVMAVTAVSGLSIAFVPVLAALLATSALGVMALLVLCRYTSRDGEDRNRLIAWTLGTFALHLLLGIALVVVGGESFLSGTDAGTYQRHALQIVEHWRRDLPVERVVGGGKEGFSYMLAGLYYVVGPYAVAGLAANAFLAAALTPLMADVTKRLFGEEAARHAPPLLLLPGFLIWTSQLLREAGVLVLIALALTAAVRLTEGARPMRVIAFTGSLALLFTFRSNVALIVAGGLIIGLGVGTRQLMAGLGTGVSAAVLLFSLVIGAGVGYSGYQFATNADFEQLNTTRLDLSRSAESGFAPDADVSTTGRAVLYLPLGFTTFALGPFPWQITNARQVIVVPDAVLWWMLLPSLWRGLRAGYKRVGRRIVLLLGPAGTVAIMLSLLIGNFGTMVRERLQVVLLLVPLLALGLALRPSRQPRGARSESQLQPATIVPRADA